MDRFESSSRMRCYATLRNLHSNMDRFESYCTMVFRTYYIRIYIPIWIDLKGHSSILQFFQRCNLHSNMDRFERYNAISYVALYVHLHSNMDRFERNGDIKPLML